MVDFTDEFGAGNETRTRDIHVGNVVLYQLSYSRLGVAERFDTLTERGQYSTAMESILEALNGNPRR